MVIDKNKVKIELYKSKVSAYISHYMYGNVYYTVEMADGKFQFPIETVDTHEEKVKCENGKTKIVVIVDDLSSDLGSTTFSAEIKASELNRWIVKAIDKDKFIKVG